MINVEHDIDRTTIIRETLLRITSMQNIRLEQARTQEDIDAAYEFAANATAELQQYFTRSAKDLQAIANKYKR